MYWKYFKYVMKHKINFFKVSYKYNLWTAITHDLSKFHPKEFKAYAEHFFGKHECIKCKYYSNCQNNVLGFKNKMDANNCYLYKYDDLTRAIYHHITHNKHHWNYWCYDIESYKDNMFDLSLFKLDKPREIPEKYLEELIWDWKAIAMSNDSKAQIYYLTHYKEIEFERETRIILEWMLNINHSFECDYAHTLQEFANMFTKEEFDFFVGRFIKDVYNIDAYELLKNKEI